MSYCKKYERRPSAVQCLLCEYCLPPNKRINDKMCEDEITNKEE